jgi:hypothetical protein
MNPLLTIFLMLLTPYAFAQDPVVKTEIVSIALDESVNELYFYNGNDISLFQANPTGMGEPLRYQGPQRFMLRTSKQEFAMKPPLPAPHAAVDLPMNTERVLLACLKTGNTPVKLVAYDIGRSRIGAGDYRFFNFSHSTVSMILGERKFAIKPGQESVITDAAWKKEVSEIDVAMAIMKDNQMKPVYSAQWGNRPGRRNYIFLFDGPQDYKPIRICRFFDVPPAEPEKAKP